MQNVRRGAINSLWRDRRIVFRDLITAGRDVLIIESGSSLAHRNALMAHDHYSDSFAQLTVKSKGSGRKYDVSAKIPCDPSKNLR